MKTICAPHFSLTLPQDARDLTVWRFAFPDLGDLPPWLTAQLLVPFGPSESLEARLRAQLAPLLDASRDPHLGDVSTGTRETWRYAVVVLEHGDPESRLREKHMLVEAPSLPGSLLAIAAVDLERNVSRSGPVLDTIMRSLLIPRI